MEDNGHKNKRKEPSWTDKPEDSDCEHYPALQPEKSLNNSNEPIEIDGSYKEGGGQILRNAITYAVLLRKKSVTINDIRANRPKRPGVRPQHLAGMKLAVEIGNASCGERDGSGGGGGELVGAEVGAKTVSFVHRGRTDGTAGEGEGEGCSRDDDADRANAFVADTGTAGSIALLLQAAFLPALVAAARRGRIPRLPEMRRTVARRPVRIELRGGTNAAGAPQIDYVTDVFAPFVNSYFRRRGEGEDGEPPPLDIRIVKRGYYPRGGGVVRVDLRPPSSLPSSPSASAFPPIRLVEPRPVASISIKAFHAGGCPARVAEEMASGAAEELKRAWRENPRFRDRIANDVGGASERGGTVRPSPVIDGAAVRITHETNCVGSGSGILIVAHPENDEGLRTAFPPCPALASSGLGDRKVPPLRTGSDAAKELVECIAGGGCVDRWLQDQLIPLMALADGGERSEVLTGELTLHSRTAMHVAEQMTGCQFEVERLNCDGSGDAGDGNREPDNAYGETGRVLGGHIIRCRGIGFSYS